MSLVVLKNLELSRSLWFLIIRSVSSWFRNWNWLLVNSRVVSNETPKSRLEILLISRDWPSKRSAAVVLLRNLMLKSSTRTRLKIWWSILGASLNKLQNGMLASALSFSAIQTMLVWPKIASGWTHKSGKRCQCKKPVNSKLTIGTSKRPICNQTLFGRIWVSLAALRSSKEWCYLWLLSSSVLFYWHPLMRLVAW